MLHHLITSKTRLRLMLKFFLQPGTEGYLRGLTREFGDSTNAVRVELNRFADQGMLVSREEKNLKIYRANAEHPSYEDITDLVRRYMQWDYLVENVRLEKTKNIFVVENKSDPHLFQYVVETENGDNHEKLIQSTDHTLQVSLRGRKEINRLIHKDEPFIKVWHTQKKKKEVLS